jgi:UDP-glucose 4-epimerase
MTRILAFGANGLIGAHTLPLLVARGHEVVTFSRGPQAPADVLGIERGDIADKKAVVTAFEKWRPETVLQLAATLQFQCEEDPALAVATNLTGAANVFEAAAAYGVKRFVFASSIAAYGERRDIMREDDPPAAAITLYGEMKRLGERLGRRFAERAGMSFAALRYSGVFGPRAASGGSSGRGMSLARHLLMGTADGTDADLEFVDGTETVHLTYVADAAEATVRALTNSSLAYTIYNIGGPVDGHLSLRDFHAAVRRVVPSAGDARFGAKPGAKSAGPLDIARMRDDLGWEPRFGIEAGLRLALGLDA